MAGKTYTAQEMYKVADCFICGGGHDLLDGNMETFNFSKKDISAMLRQAAKMRERCEAEITKLPYPPNADDVYMFKRLNYILRGDAGKEER